MLPLATVSTVKHYRLGCSLMLHCLVTATELGYLSSYCGPYGRSWLSALLELLQCSYLI
uniref:Uncharacterized protein n=1 Tax=Arundo donax TaxID=35708 RepID=A0A0A9A9I0_ARUDO